MPGQGKAKQGVARTRTSLAQETEGRVEAGGVCTSDSNCSFGLACGDGTCRIWS